MNNNQLETAEADQQPVYHHKMRQRIRTSLSHQNHTSHHTSSADEPNNFFQSPKNVSFGTQSMLMLL